MANRKNIEEYPPSVKNQVLNNLRKIQNTGEHIFDYQNSGQVTVYCTVKKVKGNPNELKICRVYKHNASGKKAQDDKNQIIELEAA